MSNADVLRTLIKQHKLSRSRVAALCDASIHTVHSWLLPSAAKAHRNMPDRALRLLRAGLPQSSN